MAFVYWIKLKEHTDLLNQGYVGITNNTVDARWLEHMRVVKSIDVPSPHVSIGIVHRAIYKYKEDIIVETLCECEHDYALWLENQLRPIPNIGWNIAAGGGSSMLGRKQTDKQKNAAREANLGKYIDKSNIERVAEINRNRVISEAELLKRKKAAQDKHLLDLCSTNKDILSRTNDIYECYLKGYRLHKTATKLGLPRLRGTRALFRRFDNGYNPLEDTRLQEFIRQYVEQNGIYQLDRDSLDSSTAKPPRNIFINARGNVIAYFTHNKKRHSKEFNAARLTLEGAILEAELWLQETRASLGVQIIENR